MNHEYSLFTKKGQISTNFITNYQKVSVKSSNIPSNFRYFGAFWAIATGTIFGWEEMMVGLAQGSLGGHLQD